ncbi:MAG TPA: hypothetical protein VIV06_04875 [Candidatus Limnocylindrales bacterium]
MSATSATLARMDPNSDVSAPRPRPDECLRCGGAIESLGVERFRSGGTTGGWKLLFGEWAELGEATIDFEVLACRACGHVELRIPPHD